jgi:hypothetical protein
MNFGKIKDHVPKHKRDPNKEYKNAIVGGRKPSEPA